MVGWITVGVVAVTLAIALPLALLTQFSNSRMYTALNT